MKELQSLMRRCDTFAIESPEKAAKNMSSAGVFIVSSIPMKTAYPLYWLLHVRGKNKSFSDNKRSNQNLKRHTSALWQAGYTEVFEGEVGFDEVWSSVVTSCSKLGKSPSNRTIGPRFRGRRFFALKTELLSVAEAHTVSEGAASCARQQARVFAARVSASINDDAQKRLRRLQTANQSAERVLRVVEAFRRNPDVVAQRLWMANGSCEECNGEAPFLRASDGTPFLEVHHITPLSEGGLDTVENTQALCPNCHRKAHFG